MATEFKLPELGEGVESADVSRIYISPGDAIRANQNVMELETEKAVAELPCPHAGNVSKIHIAEGDTIKIGQTLLTIDDVSTEPDRPPDGEQPQESTRKESNDETSEHEKKKEKVQPMGKTSEARSDSDDSGEQLLDSSDKSAPSDRKKTASVNRAGDESNATSEASGKIEESADDNEESENKNAKKVGGDERRENSSSEPKKRERDDKKTTPLPAGPATRRLARKLGVDLHDLHPTDGDRIQSEDVVRQYVFHSTTMQSNEMLPDFSRFGPVKHVQLAKIARTAARRLTTSWRMVPHVTQHGLADITELESARRQFNEQAASHSAKITLTSIVLKLISRLLREFPKFNSSLDTNSNELILKQFYHIGVAVDTDHGLVVPVIRDTDRKSIAEIANELRDIADRARQRQLRQQDFEGGTFTLSNQGSIGGGEFTPIVNYPEVAILGMARARKELRMIEGRPVERLMLPLSLSYDHRVINGADAARFIVWLTEILSDQFQLLTST